ncbi:MAG TPA: hypothetical protein VIL42_04405 [Sphingomicrobium sp.]|jgi:hypothetical protein
MIEQSDETLYPAEQAAPAQYGEALLYDLSKFLTTLGILALGGVLTLSEGVNLADVKLGNIVMVTVALGTSAAIGALTATIIAIARYKGEPLPRSLDRWLLAGVGLLSMGVGMFAYMWMDKLN